MIEKNDINLAHTVKLRQWCLSEDDIEAFRQLARRADHSLTDGFLPEFYSEDCEYRWIKGMVDSLFWGDELHYAVEVDGKAVGCVNVSRGSGVYSRLGVLRLVLLPEMCGHGIGTHVVERVVRDSFLCYGHLSTRFERLHARVIGDNKAAVRALVKNGFVYEGTLRNAACKNNQTYDLNVYGLVAPDSGNITVKPLSQDQEERIAIIHELLNQK